MGEHGHLVPMGLREFQESGLLYLANRQLHLFGVALMAVAQESGEVTDLQVVRTTDPQGLVFSEESENECRARLARWLRQHWFPDGQV